MKGPHVACRFQGMVMSPVTICEISLLISNGLMSPVDFKKCQCPLLNLKPIFHCDAKPFVLAPRVGLDPQRHHFALGIPTCWYLKTLNFALPKHEC